MMVIISGLPLKTKYQDVKVILKNECHITEFIMDDLVVDESGKGKKVRVGLVEDCDGYEIIQCLNGLRMPGNYVLRVEAVGKPPLGSQQHHGNYEPKAAPSYINDYRDSYPDQQSNDLRGRPHAPGLEAPYTAQESQFSGLAPHGSSANHGPISSHTPVDSLVRSSPWVANNGSNNLWNQNQSLNSQNSYQQPGNPGYAQYSSNAQRPITGPYPQGKVQHDPGYGYLDKTTNKLEMTVPRKADARPHVLRNVELVDTQPATPALQSGRYPLNQGFQQQKPITIMKDNFQGPTTYDVGSTNPSNIYQRLNQDHSQSWVQQGQQFKPQLYPKSNADQYEKPYEEFRQYGIDKHGDLRKNIQPPLRTDVYKDFEKPAQHFSPHRVIAHSGRQFSPSRRLISPPGSHVRALSPSNQLPHGRRISPSGKLRSPTRRLISPADRMMSSIDRRPGGPPHDLSQRHQLSPQEKFGHRNVPRYSPKRHHPDKPTDKSIDMDPLKSSKQTRSTYDVQAPNEPMNSGDFRPNVHENAPFSRSSRQLEQDVSWQHNEDQLYGKMKKRIADVHYTSRQNIYGDKHLPRRSRSPVRRDRQPVKDRFRRHSPSTSSPRRSWAFEKHRSPEVREAPPPPNWPGQSSRDDGRFKAVSDRKEDNTKHVPSWDTHAFTKIDESNRRDDKLELFAGPSKVFRDDFGNKIDKSHNEPISKPLRDPNFGGRNEFENRGGYRQTTHDEQKRGIDYHHSVERESTRRQGEFRRKESPRREEGKGNDYKGMNKEIERIYQRAQEFKEKEMRKSERRLNEYSEERDRISRIMEDKDQRAALSHRMDDTSWHHMDESSRRHMEASPRRRTDDLPRRRIEDSPRRRTEDSPGRRMEDSSRRRIENSPRRRMEHSPPRRRMEDSPRHRMEDSPRRRMKDSPRFHMDVSPRRHMEASPRRRVDDSPRQSHTDIEHRHRNESDTKTSPPNQPVWKTADKAKKLYAGLPVYIKGKINKAAEEIAVKLMSKKPMILDLNSEARHRILEELKIVVSLKLTELFDVQDVSFIELIIKFQSKISDKEQNKMFDDVIKSLPGRFRSWKTMGSDSSNMPHRKPQLFTDDRSVEETPDMLNRKLKRSPDRMMQMSSEVPLKKSKLSPEYKTKGATVAHSNHCDVYIPDWKLNIDPPKLQAPTMQLMPPQLPVSNIAPGHIGIPQLVPPHLVIPTLSSSPAQWMMVTPQFNKDVPLQSDNMAMIRPTEALYELFLCQDDFEFITAIQAELLKNFIVSEIVKVTENSQGWAPDFTFRGLQSMRRYVMCTKDEVSRDWLMNLDFSGFAFFNVLVYTKEELWYERAAIWFPGHSRFRKIEPLEKLRLQNKKLEGVNIGKWKMVKKIVTLNGTRLYVDMPPSSARALEKHNMLLSYELLKVDVFLKAVAVDKDVFDAGIKEKSITDESTLKNIIQNTVMPSIENNPSVLKIALSGCKNLTVEQARQIKESIIYHIYKYHIAGGISKTDFINYGFISPHYLGVIPENTETKRWLMNRYLGKLNRRTIIVIGGCGEDSAKYFNMSITVPNEQNITALAVLEKLKLSNQGVKGINFQLWKPIKLKLCGDKTKVQIHLDVDLQSAETLIEMDYALDYMIFPNKNITVRVDSDLARHKLLDNINDIKKQSFDNYDAANMELDSGSDNDDLVCIN